MKLFNLCLLVLLIFAFLGVNQVFAAYDHKYVVLSIKGKEYTAKDKIPVKPGQTLTFKAKFMGGYRKSCLNPHTSKFVQVLSSGENGSVSVNTMTKSRLEYKLLSETVNVTTAGNLKLLSQGGNQAAVKIPDGNRVNYSMRVVVSTKWSFTNTSLRNNRVVINRETPQSAGDTFFFEIGNPPAGDDSNVGRWFTSYNIIVEGTEDNGLRAKLNDLQAYLNNMSQNFVNKKFIIASQQLKSLIATVDSINTYVISLKSKNPGFKCDITFIGLPTDKIMKEIDKLEKSKDKLKELAAIAQGNHNKVNEMLSGTQNVFSANILKSVFKNYLNWSGSLPTDATAGLASYSTNTGIADLPRSFMSWYDDAKTDSNILRNQARKVRALTDLREFYLKKQETAIADRKKVNDSLASMEPQIIKQIDNELKTYFQSLSWAKWRPSAK